MLKENTVAISIEEEELSKTAFEKARWKTRYMRELEEHGFFTINSRNELANLVQGTKVKIPLTFLERLPGQPRIFFNEKELWELAESIKLGKDVENPVNIVIRKNSHGKYHGVIFGGERRWRASKLAGMTHVICMIHILPDDELYIRSATDNVGKVPLTAIEEALVVINLEEKYGWTEEYIAKRLAKSVQTVRNLKRYLNLKKPYQKMLLNGELTKGESLILANWKQEDQDDIFKILWKIKEEKDGKIHPKDLDLLVRRKAEKTGLKKPPPSKKSKGKRLEDSIDLVIKKIMRGMKNFGSILELADNLKKSETLKSKIHIMELVGSMEEPLKKFQRVFERIDSWD